jgi:hypothetical protein
MEEKQTNQKPSPDLPKAGAEVWSLRKLSTGEKVGEEAHMPEVHEPKPAQSGKISIGMDELQALISASVSQAVEASSKVIAAALVESRKPYVDPRAEANDKVMREQMREVHNRINAEIEASRDQCAHLQGSNALSEFQGQLGSFVLHQLDTGVVVGICTNCQKQIWSNRKEDAEWFRKKSANRMSRAGQRVFMNPTKAMEAR